MQSASFYDPSLLMCIKKTRAIFVSAAALVIFVLSGFGAFAKDAEMQELKDASDASLPLRGKESETTSSSTRTGGVSLSPIISRGAEARSS